MRKISLMTVLCCLMVAFSANVFGQQVDQKNGDWSKPSTWDGGSKPNSTSKVSIENGYTITSRTTKDVAGTVTLSNGTLTTTDAGKLTVSNGMTINGGTLNNNGTVATGSGMTVNNGIVTNRGTINGSMSVSGGNVTNRGTIAGNLTVSGGTVTSNGTITGGLTVNGGAVTISGGKVGSPVKVNEGATLTVKIGATIDLTGAEITGTLSIEEGVNVIGSYDNPLKFKRTLKGRRWNFFGLPIAGEETGIGIAPLAADNAPDIWAVRYNYENNQWDENYLHWNETTKDYINAGEGIFAWLDTAYVLEIEGKMVSGDVSITRTINEITVGDNSCKWFALANPYSAAINASSVASLGQGQVWYSYNGTIWKTATSGTIPSGEGFFLNMTTDGEHTITFTPSMIAGASQSKSTTAERDFLTVSVSTDGYKVPVMFAKNEAAREDYDIFDANKLFGDGSVAEPYLLCNSINLCKEEVNSLPYTATMNIKSGEAQSIDIIAENIPEGYSLVLLDGEEEIAMNQGDIYPVNIASGENADRFKLKIGEKNVSITDVEKVADLSIRNNNRNIIIEGGKNIRAEVYNTLGQKVYETTARNFNIEGVAAGAYVIKVQSGKAVQSQKVIIR